MLAVRTFACDACGTAHADVERPPRCADCGAAAFTELDRPDGAADYFAPAGPWGGHSGGAGSDDGPDDRDDAGGRAG